MKRIKIYPHIKYQEIQWKACGGSVHSDTLGKLKYPKERLRGKGCRVCEKEYLTVFPKLAVMFYAGMKHIKVQIDTDKVIGIPLEMYLPEENVAIETVSRTEKIEILKAHLCKKREIKLIKIPYTLESGEADFAAKIKKRFAAYTSS